jgi:glycine/D-amino acid oxidase-like deaminating enzyme
MSSRKSRHSWGTPPWTISFKSKNRITETPRVADFVVIGGGFTGLAAATWLRRLAPKQTVVVLEAGRVGAGASGRTGGMALSESAAGKLTGLRDVLSIPLANWKLTAISIFEALGKLRVRQHNILKN